MLSWTEMLAPDMGAPVAAVPDSVMALGVVPFPPPQAVKINAVAKPIPKKFNFFINDFL